MKETACRKVLGGGRMLSLLGVYVRRPARTPAKPGVAVTSWEISSFAAMLIGYSRLRGGAVLRKLSKSIYEPASGHS